MMKNKSSKGSRIQGKIVFQQLEGGIWCLADHSGQQYQLLDPPQALQKEGLEVVVQGKIQEDVMSFGMVGIPLQVDSYVIQNQ